MRGRPFAVALALATLSQAGLVHAEAGGLPSLAADGSSVAPTSEGALGLAHVLAARVGDPFRLRIAVRGGYFEQAGLFVGGSGADVHTSSVGTIAVSLTGPDVPVLRNLELFGAVSSAANRNARVDPARSDPEVILTLARSSVGLKAAFDTGPGQSAGAAVQARFVTGPGAVASNLDATILSADLLGAFDLAAMRGLPFPLVAHVDARFVHDPSLAVLPLGQCEGAVGGDSCIRSRAVQTYSYGLGSSRVGLGVALESPTRALAPIGIERLAPFVEYHFGLNVSDGDAVTARALERAGAASTPTAAVSQFATLGLRVQPSRRVAIDLGADFGVQGPSFVYGSPIPTWSTFAGFAYTFEREHDRAPEPACVEAPRSEVAAAEPSAPPGESQETPPNASPAPAPETAPDLAPAPMVEVGAALVPVSLRVLDEGDDDLSDAPTTSVAVVEANAPDRVVATGPRFALPPGDYVLHVEAAGHAPRERSLGLVAGARVELELFVRRNPVRPAVTVTANALELGEPVRFGHRDAKLRPEAGAVLDAIVAALTQHPEIARLAIEGHTDDRGGARANLKLSRDRAEAVRRYLVEHGVDARRLSAEGFGESRPLEPNVSDRGRARNRRVELRIVR